MPRPRPWVPLVSSPNHPPTSSSSAPHPVMPPPPRNRPPHRGPHDLRSGSAKAPTPRASPLSRSGPASSRPSTPVWARVPLTSTSRIPVTSLLRAHAVSSRQNVTSNHRASDTVVCEGRPQVLNGRFMYGPLDVVTLTGEKVRTQRPQSRVDRPPSGRPRPKREVRVLPPVPRIAPSPTRLSPQPRPPPTTGPPWPSSAQRQGDPLAPSPC